MRIFEMFGSVLLEDNGINEQLEGIDKSASRTHDTFMDGIGTVAKWSSAIVLAAGASVVAVLGLAASFDEDLTEALNGIQAATGYSEKEMSTMKDTLLDIYNNNFGEDFEDIGEAMEEVGKQTGATGEELELLTTNALMLRDTFEFDVTESVRAANMMMEQFGISGEDAYNLIAQGAQNGLDKNGDLLDTINEYSATFEAQGFSVEEMFNMLQNGAKDGVFSVDKLGDAVKEFGIRTKDGSDTSAAAFEALDLNAEELTKEFGAGGDTAKVAFEKTTKALFAMKDPIAQEAAGVALFGTQWEDLGVKGVKALVETRGEIDLAKDALKGINDIKYNTFGEAMEGIGRNLKTGILIPLGEAVLPLLNDFLGWIKGKMPQIQNFIDKSMQVAGDALKSVGDSITNTLIPAFKAIWEWIQPYMPLIKGAIKLNFDIAMAIFKGMSDFVTKVLIPSLKAIWEWIQPYMPQIKDAVKTAFDIIKNAFKVTSDFITARLVPIFKDMAKWFFDNFPLIKDAVKKAYDYIKPSFDNLVKVIRDSVMPIIDGLWGVVKKAMPGIQAIFELVFPLIVLAVKLAIDIIADVIKVVKGIYDFIKPGLDDVAELFSTIFGGIADAIQKARDVLAWFNDDEIDDKESTVTTTHIDKNEGRQWGFNANGTDNWRGGLSWVGEEGPELVNLPKGSQVVPNKESMAMAKGNTTIVQHFHNMVLSPSEMARQSKRAQQELALSF